MLRIVQVCIEGCGRVRVFKCPENFSPIPDFDHRVLDAQIAQAEIDAAVNSVADFKAKVQSARVESDGLALEILRRRAQLKADLAAMKQNDPLWWLGVFG